MAVDLYGATWSDVDELVVWSVERSTNPSLEAVERWIELGAAELAPKVGDLTVCADQVEEFQVRARHIVALFAAAMAEDAHYPERALRDDRDDRYGELLWKRHADLTRSLVTAVEECRDARTGGIRGSAAHSFPSTPMFTRDMGF